MAASSYYKLSNYPAPNLNQPEPYDGRNYANSADITSHDHHQAYDPPLSHSVEPPSKPLVQSTSTQLPRPLKLTTNPNANPNSRLRERKYQRWRRFLRICQALTNVVSAILSGIMFGIMIYVIVKFITTKGTLRNNRNAWPQHNLKLWPTIMLLAGSGLTLLLSLITLISYCINSERAQRSWLLILVKYAIHILAWAIVSFLYRYEKSLHGVNNDLWGWACSQEQTAIQQEFRGVVQFTPLCNAQVSWHFSRTIVGVCTC